MDSEMNLSEVLHDNWLMHQEEDAIVMGDIHSTVHANDEIRRENNEESRNDEEEDRYEEEEIELLEVGPPIQTHLEDPKEVRSVLKIDAEVVSTNKECTSAGNEKRVLISPPYLEDQLRLAGKAVTARREDNQKPSSEKHPNTQQPPDCYPNHVPSNASSFSATYHQTYVPMVRNKKSSALSHALQRPNQMHPSSTMFYLTSYPVPYGVAQLAAIQQNSDMNNSEVGENKLRDSLVNIKDSNMHHVSYLSILKKETSSSPNAFPISGCSSQPTPTLFIPNHHNRCFDLPVNVLDGNVDESCDEQNESLDEQDDTLDGRQSSIEKTVSNGGDADGADDSVEGQRKEEKPAEEESGERDAKDAKRNEREEADEEIVVDVREDEEERATAVVASAAGAGGPVESATSPTGQESARSELATLLMQPVKRPTYQEFPYLVTFSASGTQQAVQQQSSKTMQFYQPPAQQHLARATPPPGFAQPYAINMRPHEEETRQIMNLDNQQTHSSSPTSSWSQPYAQMTNLNAYQPRGQPLYAPPVPTAMVHQNGPPGVVPTSNPYYQTPHGPPHHHMQPQAPMMPPGMHAQQQPYYNTQSPLTGTPPSMNYGTPQMPAPPATNGSAPIFNFSKPRTSNESSSGTGGGHRRKKQNDLSSPRYNNNSDEVDASVFPDMSDFPLLDVVQSKAKKDAGRKPCRPHLCEQSRMLISRVCHFHREFIKRLPARHALANSPFSKPDQWTSAIMGISLATVRKCVDMAVDEEVFTRCTDKNLVNLTPAERAEREELLSKLSTVFEDEKSLGAGTAGLTIAEYSPRRSYSNSLLRQSTDDKSSSSSFAMNGADFGNSETTLLNLDEHSNSSKDFGTTPTPSTDLINGGQVFEEIGVIGVNEAEKEMAPKVETPKRGRPRKTPGTTTTKSSRRKESNEDSEVAEDKDEHEKKTEDEDETNEETEKKTEEPQQVVVVEREDDAASSEGTNRSETATPEPAATATTTVSASKKARATRRKKRSNVGVDEDYTAVAKKKRGSVASANAAVAPTQLDDENEEHKMVTRARSRQP